MNRYFAGIDLGGTSIKAALADLSGDIVAQRDIPTESHRGPKTVIGRMADAVEQLLVEVGGSTGEGIACLGVGVPGQVDRATGETLFLPNLPTQWRNVPLWRMLVDRLGCCVRILNDARAATLGELQFGRGREFAGNERRLTMAFFSLGTGVGGGIAIDGQLRLGPLGAAGEIGHQTILPNGPRCGCGNRGCLEALASGPAIVAEGVRLARAGLAPMLFDLVEGDYNRITPKEMLLASEQGDELVGEALRRAAEYIGIAAANVVTVLHPELIVLGGGVAELGEMLVDTVRQVVRERVGMFPTDGVRVERSLLGDKAGVFGAIALARENEG